MAICRMKLERIKGGGRMKRHTSPWFAVYGLMVILLGAAALGLMLPGLKADDWQSYVILLAMGMFLEWFVISTPNGDFSLSFVLVFVTFILFGTPATVWISALATVFARGIVNHGHSMKTVLFNGAQYALSALLAGIVYEQAGGQIAPQADKLMASNWLPLAAYVVTYFVTNHLLVNIYAAREQARALYPYWRDVFKLELFTCALSICLGALTVLLYRVIGSAGVFLLLGLIILVNALLKTYFELGLAHRELKALHEIALQASLTLKTGELLHKILHQALKVVKYHTAIIYLWREELEQLVPQVVISNNPNYKAWLENTTVEAGDGLIGQVVRTRQTVIVYDCKRDKLIRRMPGIYQIMRSLLILPMVADDKLVGVMVLGKREPFGFKENQKQLLTIMAGQAALATERALLYEKIENMAITDGLTCIYNHRYFYARLEEEFQRAKRYHHPFSLLLLDVDHFKKFNDTYGHQAGDKVLQRVAKVLTRETRRSDVVARYGGEEFAVLLPNTELANAVRLANRIRLAIKGEPVEIGSNRPLVSVTVSIGVAQAPVHGHEPGELIEAADRALYHAKGAGRNRVSTAEEAEEVD